VGEIEIWGDGFGGVPAHEGLVFAELNANSAGTLYQDVVTTPGATMTWTLFHRARDGADTMRVLIGDATTADVLTDDGWNSISDDLVDDTSAWGEHSDSYVVPDGQTCTRFGFRAVSAGSGNASVGNFLDAIAFSIGIPVAVTPAPSPTHAAVGATSRPNVTPPPTDSLVGRSTITAGLGAVLVALGSLAVFGIVAVHGARRGA
jgi:hypothetical protein